MPVERKVTIELSDPAIKELRKEMAGIRRRDRLASILHHGCHFILSVLGFAIFGPLASNVDIYLNGNDVSDDTTRVIAKHNGKAGLGFVEVLLRDAEGEPILNHQRMEVMTVWRFGIVEVRGL